MNLCTDAGEVLVASASSASVFAFADKAGAAAVAARASAAFETPAMAMTGMAAASAPESVPLSCVTWITVRPSVVSVEFAEAVLFTATNVWE
jgi:hypothetical protein